MTARPMTKGGVMMGSTVSTRSVRLARKPVRVTTSANARPRIVVESPTSTAIHSEFQATPHVTDRARQSSPQMLDEKNFRTKRAGATLARVVLKGAQEDRQHRKEDERDDDRDHESDRSHHEHVALDQASRRDARGSRGTGMRR